MSEPIQGASEHVREARALLENACSLGSDDFTAVSDAGVLVASRLSEVADLQRATVHALLAIAERLT